MGFLKFHFQLFFTIIDTQRFYTDFLNYYLGSLLALVVCVCVCVCVFVCLCVYSLGLFLYIVRSSTGRDRFSSSFPIWTPFIYY